MVDERDDDPNKDRDRAAILARRQHFIAIALTGLASTATACDGPVRSPKGNSGPASTPQPCLDYAPPPEERAEAEAGEPAQDTNSGPGDDEPPPQACLKIAEPEPEPEPVIEEPVPQVCLKIAEPEHETEQPKPPPRPCLKKRPPDDSRPKPTPKPCLRTPDPGTSELFE